MAEPAYPTMIDTTVETPRDARQFLRDSMPVTQKLAYFDHAAVAPIPQQAAQRIREYADQATQFGDYHWLDWAKLLGRLRSRCASLVGADQKEVGLIPNTTHGIGLIAEGFPWQPGDNMLIPANEFPSNSIPWHNLERLGVEIRRVPVPPNGEFGSGDFQKLIDKRTRLISVSWVGYSSGFRVELASLAELARAHDIRLFVDAIQGLGVFPLDVNRDGVDFLAADGHKWMLGPEGAGFLFVRETLLNDLAPVGTGWNSLEFGSFDPASTRIKSSVARYEGGTQCMASMHGFGESLELLSECMTKFGDSSIAQSVLENIDQLAHRFAVAGFDVHLPANERNRSGILGVSWKNADSKTLASARKYLMEKGIVTSVRCERLRISTHAYNSADEINRLVSELAEYRATVANAR